MVDTFEGTSVGEWVNATKQLVKFACIDVQRREAAISKHQAPLHVAAEDGEDAERLNPNVVQVLEDQRRDAEADEREAEATAAQSAFVDDALSKLPGKQRAVLELDREGVPVEEIERRMEISGESVYAARSRGLKQLAKLREEYRP